MADDGFEEEGRRAAAVFAWAQANGFETIRAEVAADNARALRFYEKHGFVRAGAPPADSSQANLLLTKRVRQVSS